MIVADLNLISFGYSNRNYVWRCCCTYTVSTQPLKLHNLYLVVHLYYVAWQKPKKGNNRRNTTEKEYKYRYVNKIIIKSYTNLQSMSD